MTALFSWLARTFLLYILLALAIGLAMAVMPNAPAFLEGWREDTAGIAEVNEQIAAAREEAQRELNEYEQIVKTASSQEIGARIAQAEKRRADLSGQLGEQDSEWLARYRPSRIVRRKQTEIALAFTDSNLALLRAVEEPRAQIEAAQSYLEQNPSKPTAQDVTNAQEACNAARGNLDQFESRSTIEQRLRETVRSEQTVLVEAANEACRDYRDQARFRQRAIEAEATLQGAREAIGTLRAETLPASFTQGLSRTVLRDILLNALFALLAILLLPFVWRFLLYYGLAPWAERWPPMQFDVRSSALEAQPNTQAESSVSIAVTLGAGEEALVRQDFLQSTSLKGEKRTRWLLNWSSPITSFVSGMRFLTAITGEGEEVLVSAVKDPLAELALFEIPEGSAAIIRPSALAGLIQQSEEPLRIASHWRLFSLPAWLTFQLRYLAFHGPAQLVLKGGRGVRIEKAQSGRIVGQSQLIGFTTQSRYSVIRCETFWPYFFGRESLLKDRIEGEEGVLLVEETPLAGSSGLKRGLKGIIDAALKLFGV